MLDLAQTTKISPPDPLLLERLQTFFDKSLNEIKSFSERENLSLEETRRYVAEWHCSYLFGRESQPAPRVSMVERRKYIRSVLSETSRTLESLHTLSGTHSFFLTVDPPDAEDKGFLGGTVLGREFWRGFRGGGDAGAKNFKSYCLKNSARGASIITPGIQKNNCIRSEASGSSPGAGAIVISKRSPASSLKTEVYINVRNALRSTSGNRTAEMKWSNHDRLSVYNVRLIGWPSSIPQLNPSSMTVVQNKLLLQALADGRMRFERINTAWQLQPVSEPKRGNVVESQENADISWAYEDKQSGPFTPPQVSDLITEPPLTWHNDQAGPSRPTPPQHSQQQRYSPHQLPPNRLNDFTDPTSYLLEYDMQCINDLAEARQSAELSPPPDPQLPEVIEGRLSAIDGIVGIYESEAETLSIPRKPTMDERLPKKRRIDEDGLY